MLKEKDLNTYREILKVFQKRSTCKSLKVSAIIIKDGRIISTGWNGVPSGFKHCEDRDWSDCKNHDEWRRKHLEFQKKYETHAEMNAIAFAAKNGIKTEGSVIFSSISPCNDCAKLILQSGIKEVYYIKKYDRPDFDGLSLLKKAKIRCYKIEE